MREQAGGTSACRLCATPVNRIVLDLGEQPLADDVVPSRDEPPRGRLLLVRCDACGLLQTPATGLVANMPTHGHGASTSSSLQAHLRAWGDSLSTLVDAGDTVLDIAPGERALHEPLRARGALLLPDAPAAFLDEADIRDVVARSGRARLVIVNHALAHADSLAGLVASVSGAVTPDGWVAVESHHALTIVGGDQVDVVSHVHRTYLSFETLRHAFRDVGLDVVDASRSGAYGGALRVLLRPHGAAGPSDAAAETRIAALVADEAEAGLTDGRALVSLAERVAARRPRLRMFLEHERAQGRSMAGYGAPGRAVTLLNWAGVDATLLPWTVDRSPAKQGGWIPGTGIRVRDPGALEREPVDTIVLLAWTVASELESQLAPLVARGARLAVAAPEPGFLP